ncbi:MAG: hypothetical protein DMG03_20710 [Acidobacteria bacterium]|nr:MAG: hypothetical protein DMG03_20710 [Acidobacteriota bacterium]
MAEVERLTAARTLMRDGDTLALTRLETEGPWIGIARSKLKRRLGGRRLEIWRVGYEDASGGLVESRLVVLAIHERERSPERLALRESLALSERLAEPVAESIATPVARAFQASEIRAFQASEIQAVIDSATVEWRDAVGRAVASFAAARLARETAIAASAARVRSAPIQTGLFDRRGEHAHAALEEGRRSVSEALAERKASAQRAAALVATAPKLLLVIAGAGRT